jgi:hypothetical protein
VIAGHYELQLWRASVMEGGGGISDCALTLARLAQRRGRQGRGDDGGVVDMCASSGTAARVLRGGEGHGDGYVVVAAARGRVK